MLADYRAYQIIAHTIAPWSKTGPPPPDKLFPLLRQLPKSEVDAAVDDYLKQQAAGLAHSAQLELQG